MQERINQLNALFINIERKNQLMNHQSKLNSFYKQLNLYNEIFSDVYYKESYQVLIPQYKTFVEQHMYFNNYNPNFKMFHLNIYKDGCGNSGRHVNFYNGNG